MGQEDLVRVQVRGHPYDIAQVSRGAARKQHVWTQGAPVLSARGNEHLGASILRARIKRCSGLNIPKAVIHRVMVENGMAGEDPRKKRRRWARYERTHSDSLWHTDWKQIRGGMHDGRWFLCYEDDASRFVTGYGVFGSATTENALRVLDGAIKNHGRPASIMTDHGAQLYASEKEAKEFGESGFEKRRVELGYAGYSRAWGTRRPTAR